MRVKKPIKFLTNEILHDIPNYLKNITLEEHILYHRSPNSITKYDHDYVVSIRNQRKTHDNSVMGLWSSTLPALCSGFGSFNYKVDLDKDVISKGLYLRDLFNLTADLQIEEQLKLRNRLLECCDVIYILYN